MTGDSISALLDKHFEDVRNDESDDKIKTNDLNFALASSEESSESGFMIPKVIPANTHLQGLMSGGHSDLAEALRFAPAENTKQQKLDSSHAKAKDTSYHHVELQPAYTTVNEPPPPVDLSSHADPNQPHFASNIHAQTLLNGLNSHSNQDYSHSVAQTKPTHHTNEDHLAFHHPTIDQIGYSNNMHSHSVQDFSQHSNNIANQNIPQPTETHAHEIPEMSRVIPTQRHNIASQAEPIPNEMHNNIGQAESIPNEIHTHGIPELSSFAPNRINSISNNIGGQNEQISNDMQRHTPSEMFPFGSHQRNPISSNIGGQTESMPTEVMAHGVPDLSHFSTSQINSLSNEINQHGLGFQTSSPIMQHAGDSVAHIPTQSQEQTPTEVIAHDVPDLSRFSSNQINSLSNDINQHVPGFQTPYQIIQHAVDHAAHTPPIQVHEQTLSHYATAGPILHNNMRYHDNVPQFVDKSTDQSPTMQVDPQLHNTHDTSHNQNQMNQMALSNQHIPEVTGSNNNPNPGDGNIPQSIVLHSSNDQETSRIINSANSLTDGLPSSLHQNDIYTKGHTNAVSRSQQNTGVIGTNYLRKAEESHISANEPVGTAYIPVDDHILNNEGHNHQTDMVSINEHEHRFDNTGEHYFGNPSENVLLNSDAHSSNLFGSTGEHTIGNSIESLQSQAMGVAFSPIGNVPPQSVGLAVPATPARHSEQLQQPGGAIQDNFGRKELSQTMGVAMPNDMVREDLVEGFGVGLTNNEGPNVHSQAVGMPVTTTADRTEQSEPIGVAVPTDVAENSHSNTVSVANNGELTTDGEHKLDKNSVNKETFSQILDSTRQQKQTDDDIRKAISDLNVNEQNEASRQVLQDESELKTAQHIADDMPLDEEDIKGWFTLETKTSNTPTIQT